MRRLSLVVGVSVVVVAVGFTKALPENSSNAEITVTKVAGTVYLLQGAGSNVAASVGEDGILLVDDGSAAMVAQVRSALNGITDKAVRFVINTHWHGDHVGGNAEFPEATIVAQNNVRVRMETGGRVMGADVKPFPVEALPRLTFLNDITLHMNGEDIRAIQFPGHTDGDSIVVFPRSNVVHMGDNFVGTSFPLVDVESGGSAHVLGEVIEILLRQMGPNVQFIPGHGSVARPHQLQAYLAMLQGTRAAVEDGIKQGKNLAQLKRERALAKWDKWSSRQVSTEQFLEILYADLTAAEPDVDEDHSNHSDIGRTRSGVASIPKG